MSALRYGGINRAGVPAVGMAFESPAIFTEAKYRAGWRRLDVRDEDDIPVGAIDEHPDTGKRWWWAES